MEISDLRDAGVHFAEFLALVRCPVGFQLFEMSILFLYGWSYKDLFSSLCK